MCGILLVRSRDPIPLKKHLEAMKLIESRGPDFSRYRHERGMFIGQTVLHITGDREYYDNSPQNFLAYNGEIYNYRDLGAYTTDTEFVHECVEQDLGRLKAGWGPWAWAWTDNSTVLYATDPQGERALYQYQDDSILIVSSEVAPILSYINTTKQAQPYATRNWTMLDTTPWAGISRCVPGMLYRDGHPAGAIDSIWSWIQEPQAVTADEAYEEFSSRWRMVMRQMTPACDVALTYSGGLDSSIILSHLPGAYLYTTNMRGKDPIAERVESFLNKGELTRLARFDVDEQDFALAFQACQQRLRMPIQTGSYIGQWLIAALCGQRVIFTGIGADELFGGYAVYQDLKFTADASASPYSSGTPLWRQCIDVCRGDAEAATLLADYWHQIVGCDARAADVINGAYGIEPRSPFLARPIIELALNLPTELRRGKPLIKRMFLERWAEAQIHEKKGFTGHCNDALPWMNIQIEPSGDRQQDWQQVLQRSFYAD